MRIASVFVSVRSLRYTCRSSGLTDSFRCRISLFLRTPDILRCAVWADVRKIYCSVHFPARFSSIVLTLQLFLQFTASILVCSVSRLVVILHTGLVQRTNEIQLGHPKITLNGQRYLLLRNEPTFLVDTIETRIVGSVRRSRRNNCGVIRIVCPASISIRELRTCPLMLEIDFPRASSAGFITLM